MIGPQRNRRTQLNEQGKSMKAKMVHCWERLVLFIDFRCSLGCSPFSLLSVALLCITWNCVCFGVAIHGRVLAHWVTFAHMIFGQASSLLLNTNVTFLKNLVMMIFMFCDLSVTTSCKHVVVKWKIIKLNYVKIYIY